MLYLRNNELFFIKLLLRFKRFGGSAVVYLLFIVAPIVCVRLVLGPCFVLQYFVPCLVCNHLAGV